MVIKQKSKGKFSAKERFKVFAKTYVKKKRRR